MASGCVPGSGGMQAGMGRRSSKSLFNLTCQIQQTTKTLKFVPANNSSLKVVYSKWGSVREA